jgi:hypothetical protein
MKRLIKVKRRHENQLLVRKNVLGCSVGLKQVGGEYTNTHCIVVYVSPKEDVDKKDSIPDRLDGIQTDVQELKPHTKGLGITSIAPYSYRPAKEETCLEIQKIAAVNMKLLNKVDLAISAYISLDELHAAAKQSGLFVRELENQLKQRPRFAAKAGASTGRYLEPIESIYPGAATFMRTLIRIHRLHSKGQRRIFLYRIRNMLDHLHLLTQYKHLLPYDEVSGIGKIKGFTEPRLSMRVLKSGRTTGVTEGMVAGIDASLFVDYPIGKALGRGSPDFGEPIFSPSPLDGGRFPSDIRGFLSGYVPIRFPIEEKPNLCNDFHPSYERTLFIEQIVTTAKVLPGDSGAPLTTKDLKAIGMLFAGSANLSFYNTMKNVIKHFNKALKIR